VHAECIEVDRGALRRGLLEALVLGIVEEAERAGALGDARGLVERGVADGAAEPRGLVAVGVVGERGADGAARDAGDRMRTRPD